MDYEKDFFDYALERGIDYSFYGTWQEQYIKMVLYITGANKPALDNSKSSVCLDVGTACGANLHGFQETQLFSRCIGIDISQHMIDLGIETFNFNPNDIFKHDIELNPLGFNDNSIMLLHCSQVLEHIHEDYLDKILKEFNRVLHPDGSAFIMLDVKEKMSDRDLKDVRHVTIKSNDWWKKLLSKHMVNNNRSVLAKWRRDKHYPDGNLLVPYIRKVKGKDVELERPKSFYEHYGHAWTVFGMTKK